MNFLSLFTRNLSTGPLHRTVPVRARRSRRPSGCAAASRSTRKSARAACLCEKLCPSGAIRFARTPDGHDLRLLARDLRVLRHLRVLLPDQGDPPDQRLASRPRAGQKFALAEHGLIPNQVCAECGGKGLDTAPNVAKVRPAAFGRRTRRSCARAARSAATNS